MGPSPLSNLSIHSRLLSCVASDPAQIPSAIILITFAQTLSSLVPLYLHPPGTNLSLRECNSPPSSHTSDGRALQEKTPEATRWFHHEPSHLLNNAISSQTPMCFFESFAPGLSATLHFPTKWSRLVKLSDENSLSSTPRPICIFLCALLSLCTKEDRSVLSRAP